MDVQGDLFDEGVDGKRGPILPGKGEDAGIRVKGHLLDVDIGGGLVCLKVQQVVGLGFGVTVAEGLGDGGVDRPLGPADGLVEIAGIVSKAEAHLGLSDLVGIGGVSFVGGEGGVKLVGKALELDEQRLYSGAVHAGDRRPQVGPAPCHQGVDELVELAQGDEHFGDQVEPGFELGGGDARRGWLVRQAGDIAARQLPLGEFITGKCHSVPPKSG